jgi:Domain of unknown function (DUF202)
VSGDDPGLSRERTKLSWWRTLLAGTVVALLGVRLAVLADAGAVRPFLAAGAMLVWLVALVATARRTRALAASRPAAAGRVLPLSAAICVGYAVVGAIQILTHLPG